MMIVTVAAMFLLLVSTANRSYADGPSGPIGYKSTRGGTSGLYPFPRTGRSGAVHPREFAEYFENKRSGLIPFPRVGRSDPFLRYSPDMVYLGPAPLNFDRGISAVTGGLWFNPRFGHPLKRALEEYDELPNQAEAYPVDDPGNDGHKSDRNI